MMIQSHRFQPTLASFETTGLDQLRVVIFMRAILIAALIGAYILLTYSTEISIEHIPVLALLGPISALTAFNFYSYWQIKRALPVANVVLFFQLIADNIALSIILYYTGGSTNPFVSYYLVPITISAATLPKRFTWALIISASVIYYLQFYYFIPLSLFTQMHNHEHHGASNAHFIGMWVNFLFSASLIGTFLQRMQTILKQKNAALRDSETQLHRNEQLFALGTLAAGTAHQLGTPLNTMLILVQELEQDKSLPEQARTDLLQVQRQIENCKTILHDLKQTDTTLAPSTIELNDYLKELVSTINIVRPDKLAIYNLENINPIRIQRDITLDQAITNLLNNALDESTTNEVKLSSNVENNRACIYINQPKGLHTNLPPKGIGNTPYSTKPEGMGIGIMLTFSSLERIGGSAEFIETENSITTKIVIPLLS